MEMFAGSEGTISELMAGKQHDTQRFIIPEGNLKQEIKVPSVKSLAGLYQVLACNEVNRFIEALDGSLETTATLPAADTNVTLRNIIGQELGKRAIEVSAADRHNLLLG